MIQIEEQKDLGLPVDEIIYKIESMTTAELEKEKRLCEERICNNTIEDAFQRIRLSILKAINRELEFRR